MKFATIFVLLATTIPATTGIGSVFGPAVDFLVEAIASGAKEHAGEIYVRVMNSMGPDVEITANCASADDKIDETKLKDGESFAWSFKPNIFRTTQFWCDVTTSDGKKKHWDVYIPTMDNDSPNWYLRGPGIYLGKFDGSQLQKKESWEQI
uniref:S-protein homolog n=1 Tax=Panagrolaimus superbus TaxID=310955 RepID=A0A914YUD4_9BILA